MTDFSFLKQNYSPVLSLLNPSLVFSSPFISPCLCPPSVSRGVYCRTLQQRRLSCLFRQPPLCLSPHPAVEKMSPSIHLFQRQVISKGFIVPQVQALRGRGQCLPGLPHTHRLRDPSVSRHTASEQVLSQKTIESIGSPSV